MLSRSEADPAAPLQLRPVTRLFRNVAYSIQRVTLLLGDGGTELLQVTAGHSFWVEGQGWTPAELLLAGQTVLTGDGRVATVVGSETVTHPEGVVVYNFSVEGDRTYFVDDGLGDIAAVWVHNARAKRAWSLSRRTSGLHKRADEVHSVLDPIAQGRRTTAVLQTNGGRIIGGGGRDLEGMQLALQRRGEIMARLPDKHAEITVLREARRRGLKPQILVATRDFCPNCIRALKRARATIIDARTAVWR